MMKRGPFANPICSSRAKTRRISSSATPSRSIPLTFHANYGRGINSIDARGVVERPDQPRLATTDFYQFGTSSRFGRFSLSTYAFLIDHSNEQVYIPDDGTFQFKGPSRAYGYEVKAVWARDGRTVERVQRFTVRAGDRQSVTFPAEPSE